jgi:SPP1 family predicted phage head-tail adaptor
MTIDPGRLNRRVTIQQRSGSDDAWGQPSTGWATLATVWADVRAPRGVSAAEGLSADREAAPTSYSVRIRYRTDVTPAMRVVIGAQTMDVSDVILDHAGHEYVDLVCVQGTVDGD